MENTATIVIGGFLALVSLLYMLMRHGKPKNFPPGPPAIPFLGSIPFIPTDISQEKAPFDDYLKKNWGDIAGLYIGSTPLVFISDPDTVRRVFKMDELSRRPA